MFSWGVELCLEETKWCWKCFDAAGQYVCRSRCAFNTEDEARNDFERQFEDHWACMSCRFAN